MEATVEFKNNADLMFFGKVNASISHELKNIMAIISEAAGLLNDLIEIAETGQEYDLEMIKTCSKDIVEEIQRGFTTIKQMNIFSHSMDDPLKSVNLHEVLNLVSKLAGFLSFASAVRIDLPEEAAPTVVTCPFRLQNLVYHALVFAFELVGPDAEIQVSVCPEENNRVRINFSGFGEPSARSFPSEKTKQVAASIGAEVIMTKGSQGFDILVPNLSGGME